MGGKLGGGGFWGASTLWEVYWGGGAEMGGSLGTMCETIYL